MKIIMLLLLIVSPLIAQEIEEVPFTEIKSKPIRTLDMKDIRAAIKNMLPRIQNHFGGMLVLSIK